MKAPLHWLKLAADGGHPEALIRMGNSLLSQNDATCAIEHYSRSLTNEGWFNIGHVYWNGHSRSSAPLLPDQDLALEYFKRAADNGDLDSKYFLGVNLDDISLIEEVRTCELRRMSR